MPKTKTPQHYPPAVRSVISWLERSQSLAHLSWWERFVNTIELWFYGLSRNEGEYMRAVGNLGPEATREAVPLMAQLLLSMATDPQDHLGKVYQQIGLNDRKRFAQYFTPDTVCSAMAEMSLVGLERSQFTKIGGVVIGEPACGAGAIALHALVSVYRRFGSFGTERTHLVCNDIDLLCCQMTALQLLWLQQSFQIGRVTVTHGDALRPETQRFVATFGAGTLPQYTRRIRKVVGENP